MPASPDLAQDAARGVLAVYEQAERDLLALVSRRLAAGIESDGWAERKLAEIGALRREAERTVARAAAAGTKAAEESLDAAYKAGHAQASTDLRKIGTAELRTALTGTATDAVAAHQAALVDRLSATHLRVLRYPEDVYRQVIAQASAQTAAGAQTRRQAAQVAMNRFADRGVTGFTDRAGRSWDLASYTEMATRTGAGQAAIQGHTDQLLEHGYDLVMISTSPERCPVCAPWEGKVLSLGSRIPGERLDRGFRVDGTLADAIADGLYHPNCTHSQSAYVPGLTTRDKGRTRSDQPHEDRQEQRRLERGVRQWKRREAAALSPEEAAAARARAQAWRERLNAHTDANDLKRLPYRLSTGAR